MTTAGQHYMEMIEEWSRRTQRGESQVHLTEFWLEVKGLADAMILRSHEAQDLERAGDIENAIKIYEDLVQQHHFHPGPYIRLRILYARQRRYEDAIGICKAFIALEQTKNDSERRLQDRIHPIYPEEAQRFAGWIKKYQLKLQKAR